MLLWHGFCSIGSEPHQFIFSTRNRLLFVAHGLENRWPLEILQMPRDVPPWNVKAAKFKPRGPGCQGDSWHLLYPSRWGQRWNVKPLNLRTSHHLLSTFYILGPELQASCSFSGHPSDWMLSHPFHRWVNWIPGRENNFGLQLVIWKSEFESLSVRLQSLNSNLCLYSEAKKINR